MEPLRIQIFIYLIILSSVLNAQKVHGEEGTQSERDTIVRDNPKSENSKSSESKSRVEREYDELENGRQLARDLRIEKEARRNLEVQMKQVQEKLNSLMSFKNNVENTTQNYRNMSSSVVSILVMRNLRGLTNNVSDLETKVSFLDDNLMRLQNEMKDSINSSYVTQLAETLKDAKNFERTGYQTIKFEISPNVREIEVKGHLCERIYSQQYIPCKEGWYLYNEKCYKMFADPKTWTEASEKCSEEGGHLATLSSSELQEFFNVFFMLSIRSNTWIGLNDREMESNFSWDDGSTYSPAYSYTNWDIKQPDGLSKPEEEDCIELRYGVHNSPKTYAPREVGYWNDRICNTRLPYICQMDKNKGEKKLSPDPRFCSISERGGFKYFDSCYHIVETKKSWEEAEKHCEENFSGHLVTILDAEAEMFLNYILSSINEDVWIGIRRHDDKIAQKWISGWHVAHNRLYHDLNQFPKGTCVLKSKSKSWATAECAREYPFICERSKIQAPVLKKAPRRWQCPDSSKDWIDLGGESCYIFGANKQLGWYQANYECGRKGGTLASIASNEEKKTLEYFVMEHTNVFIGLHTSLSNIHLWEWADGKNIEDTNWDIGEPTSLKGEYCAEYMGYFKAWRDIDCYKIIRRASICSAKKVPPSTIEFPASQSGDCICTKEPSIIKLVPEGLVCPDLSKGWQDVEGKYCYIFVTNVPLKWDEAHYDCGRKGGNLASIHSEEQRNILNQHVKNKVQSVYIGLHRSISKKNVFEWADGSEVDYLNWKSSEPSNINEECVEMLTKDMKWNDINCNSLRGYICAVKKVPSRFIGKTASTSSNCTCS